jgi:hypothetical protein
MAQSPSFSGTMWAYACARLASAELLLERERAEGEFEVLQLVDRDDRDECTGAYRIRDIGRPPARVTAVDR